MNQEQEREFFNQIEEVLQAHEDTYELGAWEEFDANRKKSKRKWPIYGWAAAAVVLLFACLGLLEMVKREKSYNNLSFVKNRDQQYKTKIDTIIPVKINSKSEIQLVLKDDFKAVQGAAVMVENSVKLNAAQGEQLIVTEKQAQQEPTQVTTAKDTMRASLSFEKLNKHKPVLAGAYDSLMNRKHVAAVSAPRKLTYSVMVSPSVSNQKMNFGAGMELSYRLGSHFSLNSGLLYSAMNAKSDGKSLVATNSRPQGASLAVSGIELPLGVQYQTKGGFYATAGVSALGLISDKLEYSYLQEKTVTLMEVRAGITTEVFRVVSEKKTEKSIEPLTNYLGFFNFSAGKKQAFSNVHLNIGPFVKVPFSSVSSERIKLVQGGIKVGIDF